MLVIGWSGSDARSSTLLVGERPTGTFGQARPRASCGQEVVAGGIRPRQRAPPNLHRPNRAWREEHQLRKPVEDRRRARRYPLGAALGARRWKRAGWGVEARAATRD